MTTQNLDYYRQRADEELATADQTNDPGIAQIHREMARRYHDLVGGKSGRMNGGGNRSARHGAEGR